MAGKGKHIGASPSAKVEPKVAPKDAGDVDTTGTTTPAGNEQGQGDENATANVLSAGTASEAPPDDIRAFREFDCDDVASLFDIQPGDVLTFREYDDRIVVVTTAGAKLELAK